MPRLPLAVVVLATSLLALPPGRVNASINIALSEYSVVVFGDMTGGSHTHGRAVIGGNLTGNSEFGAGLQGSFPAGDTMLTVGGTLGTGVYNIQAGGVQVGGDVTGATVNLNQHGNTLSVGGAYSGGPFNIGTLVTNTGVVPDISVLESTIKAESTAFEGLTSNSSLTSPHSNLIILDAMPTGANNQAVFDFSFSDLFSNQNASLQINDNGADSIVINITGDGTIRNNFTGTPAALGSKIIWNFVDASNLLLERQFIGSVLAPLGHLEHTNDIEGSLAVETYTQRGQVHLYTPDIPTPGGDPEEEDNAVVPEATSLLVWGLLAASGLGFTGRRR